MSKMPPDCRECHEMPATGLDGWCDACAASFDWPEEEQVQAPLPAPPLVPVLAPKVAPSVAPSVSPSATEPSYRFPF